MSSLDHPQVDTSLDEFLKSVRPRLKALFARHRIPPEDAEDILQQALLALIYQRQVIRDSEIWLFGTLRKKCALYWRERRRKLYEAVDSAALELLAQPQPPAQESTDHRNDLITAIEQLPERCRAILWLRYQGYQPMEVAARLGYSQASIGKISKRCLAALTHRLLIDERPRRKHEP